MLPKEYRENIVFRAAKRYYELPAPIIIMIDRPVVTLMYKQNLIENLHNWSKGRLELIKSP